MIQHNRIRQVQNESITVLITGWQHDGEALV